MKTYSTFIILLLIICISSCSTKKSILYMQDAVTEFEEINITKNQSHYIAAGDILKISVLSENPENLISVSQNPNYSVTNIARESYFFEGYKVDIDGFIDYPQLGRIKIVGKSINQAKELISSKLSEKQILINPTVDIKVVNWNVTVLGEVNKPGKYFFDTPNFNLIQAIGLAGDLTINGERSNVRLLRINNSNSKIYNVDLTSKEFISSELFFIKSGDVIIVNPNTNRVKNAGIIGNSGTLLSLLSFLLSSIIIIGN